MKSKNIKVTYASRYTSSYSSTVPMIRMEGKWLEELGFSIGSIIKVEYQKGAICSRPLTKEETSILEYQELKNNLSQKQTELLALEESLPSSHPKLSKAAEPSPTYNTNPSMKTK